MSLRIKKGDRVKVVAGKDKGKTGKVLRIMSSKNRIIIENVNVVKKHIRRRSESEQGGIREIPSSINIANVGLFCSHCNKAVRFGVKKSKDKTKVRICKKCQRPI
ncbi:MAG: 50S ribosomal protein L24 [Candidatus Omnitrophica bacterium]|nr:50S ribosomal protein L24 [Candidatus Omnitrophota bacterium]MBD3268561.1 50S ribosomal protein L24 [Candidatus Omnitrophota bacterium]